jgi:hypothetical protein
MVKLISFDHAMERTEGRHREILLGNGFSIRHFSYKNLLEQTELEEYDPVRELFSKLDTYDFELIIRALDDASLVGSAYGEEGRSERFKVDAVRVRESLVHAVRKTHPMHREVIADVIPSCVEFLNLFSNVFTLCYDLLLYWVILSDTRTFQDGFGLGIVKDGFRGPFKIDAHCNIFNLHGGLHLFKTELGYVEKRLMGPTGVIDAIAETITKENRLPIYVAEGKSLNKLRKIYSIDYLKHCYQKLEKSTGEFFVYGHSADQNDAHIYRALFKSGINHLYFCVHTPTADVNALDGELARYQRLNGSQIQYTLVDSQTAKVWDRLGTT